MADMISFVVKPCRPKIGTVIARWLVSPMLLRRLNRRSASASAWSWYSLSSAECTARTAVVSVPARGAGAGCVGRGTGAPPVGGLRAFHSASVHARWRAPYWLWVAQYFLAAFPTAASHASRFSRGCDSRVGSMVGVELELELIGVAGGRAGGLRGGV